MAIRSRVGLRVTVLYVFLLLLVSTCCGRLDHEFEWDGDWEIDQMLSAMVFRHLEVRRPVSIPAGPGSLKCWETAGLAGPSCSWRCASGGSPVPSPHYITCTTGQYSYLHYQYVRVSSLRRCYQRNSCSKYPVNKWLKQGHMCLFTPPLLDPIVDITIYADIAKNPGPSTSNVRNYHAAEHYGNSDCKLAVSTNGSQISCNSNVSRMQPSKALLRRVYTRAELFSRKHIRRNLPGPVFNNIKDLGILKRRGRKGGIRVKAQIPVIVMPRAIQLMAFLVLPTTADR